MSTISNYWTMPPQARLKPLPELMVFFQSLFPNFDQGDLLTLEQEKIIQIKLFEMASSKTVSNDIQNRSLALLCLRCRVSHWIPRACQTKVIKHLCSKHLDYPQVLSLLLNDDGRTLVILDDNSQVLRLLDNGKQIPIMRTYDEFLTIRILSTYRWQTQTSKSLKSWLYLLLPQYLKSVIKDYLPTEILNYKSDWAILCEELSSRHRENLSARNCILVEIFQNIYRQDKLRNKHAGGNSYHPPCDDQLRKMMTQLVEHKIKFSNPSELLLELRQLATQIRAMETTKIIPLEIQNLDTKQWNELPELPFLDLDSVNIEETELLDFIVNQLSETLSSAISEGISFHISELMKMRQGNLFAPQLIPYLKFFYFQGLSQEEIAIKLGMKGKTQVSRRFKPNKLFEFVKKRTLFLMEKSILQKAYEKGLTTLPPKPEYLKEVHYLCKVLADEKIFLEAYKERFNSKTRSRDSLYAQQIRLYLNRQDNDQGVNQ